jgi:transposase
MKVFKTHKVEIYPTKPQEEYFRECIEYSDYVYQKSVDQWYKQLDEIDIKKTRKYININEIIKYIYDNQTSYDKDFSSDIRDSACNRLKLASARYFDKIANKPRRFKKPGSRSSFTLKSRDNSKIQFKKTKKNITDDKHHKDEFNYFFGIKFGEAYRQKYGRNLIIKEFRWVKMTEEIRYPYLYDQVKTVTIFYRAKKWFAVFQIEVEEQIIDDPNRIDKVGIDVGKKTLTSFHDSNNNDFFIHFPKSILDEFDELYDDSKHYRKVLSRQTKGSNSYKTTLDKIDNNSYRLQCLVDDFHQNLSLWICKRYKTINLETLDIRKMVRRAKSKINKTLRRLLHNIKLGYLIQLIKDKSKKYANIINLLPRFYPSSQTCSSCGHKQAMPLSKRTYICPTCGLVMDRDLNAAMNIFKYI